MRSTTAEPVELSALAASAVEGIHGKRAAFSRRIAKTV